MMLMPLKERNPCPSFVYVHSLVLSGGRVPYGPYLIQQLTTAYEEIREKDTRDAFLS